MSAYFAFFRRNNFIPSAIAALALTLPLAHAGFEEGAAAMQKKDYSTALTEFTQAATQGDLDAQVILGLMYTNGGVTPKNYQLAAKWFLLAAEQGDKVAQGNCVFRRS